MYLHGKPLLCVQQLEKQRKPFRIRQAHAEDGLAKFRPQLVQCAPMQRSIVNDALRIRTVHDFPAFANARAPGQPFVHQGFEAASAPNALLEDRLEG